MREKVKKKATESSVSTYISLRWYSPRNVLSPLIPHFHQLPSPVTHKASMSFLPTPTDMSWFKHSSSPAKTVNLVCLYLNYSKELRHFSYENIFLLKWNLSAYIHVYLLFRVLILYFVTTNYYRQIFKLVAMFLPKCQDTPPCCSFSFLYASP